MPLDVRRLALLVVLAPAASFVITREAAAIRPFDGTDAAVAAEGTVEIEAGPVGWIRADAVDVLAPSAVVNVGVARGWEVSAYAQPSWVVSGRTDRRFALVDDGLVVKRILREGCLQDAAGPSVAVEVSALLPATQPLDRFGARVTPVVSQTWSGFAAHLSASVSWARTDEPAVSGALILEGPELVARVRPAIEATAGWERDAGRSWSGLGALLWSPNETLSFDLGYRLGRSFGATAQEVRAGVTWWFRTWSPRAN